MPRAGRLLPLLACLACAGCIGAVTRPPKRPEREHVFYVPKAEALAEARALLEALGFQLLPARDPDVLLTDRVKPAARVGGERETWRYAVVALEPRQGLSVVRILRVKDVTVLNDTELVRDSRDKFLADWAVYDGASVHPAYRGGRQKLDGIGREPFAPARADRGTRDLVLEQQLLERIEAPPSLELPLVDGEPRLPDAAPPEGGWLSTWTAELEPLEASAPCGGDVDGLAPLLAPGRTLLVGEQPGSREVPRAVGRIACLAARAGVPTTLALPLPHDEQARLEAYLATDGGAAAQSALLAGPVWHRARQDGRASRAMVALVERVRRLRRLGLPLSLLALDTASSGGALRQEALAARVREHRRARPGDLVVVLEGNAHVRTRDGGAPWARGVVPMGALLVRGGERVTALDVAYARGTRWLCRLDVAGEVRCGPRVVSPAGALAVPPDAALAVRLTPPADGYDGVLTVGQLTASPPALWPASTAAHAAGVGR